MGRKEFTDPESADWPVRGAHVVAPVGFGLLNSLEDVLILPPWHSARTMVIALSTLKNRRA